MIFRPRIGEAVRLHYAKRAAPFMPYHGMTGVVRLASRGPGPRNVAVELEGNLVIVPSGNLIRPPDLHQATWAPLFPPL